MTTPARAAIEAKLLAILDGIDRTEMDDNGWWETSTGAAFGAGKLAEVLAALPADLPDTTGQVEVTEAMVHAGWLSICTGCDISHDEMRIAYLAMRAAATSSGGE